MRAHVCLLLALPLLTACASPAPTEPPTATVLNEVVFACADGSQIKATFIEGSVTVAGSDGTFTLAQQPSGSGIIYSDGIRTFRGKGKEMQWEFARRAPLTCQAP